MSATSVTKNVIKHNHHMVIATADKKGTPWVSPVFYMYDEDFNLYWVSGPSALHSENIRSNPSVAICIFGPSSDQEERSIHGIYIRGIASELTKQTGITDAIKIMQLRPQPDKFMIKSISDVTENAAWRIYKAVPKEVSKRQDAVDKTSGQTISVRKDVTL